MQNRINTHYRDKLQLYFLECRYSLFRTNQQHLTPPASVKFKDWDSLKIPEIYETPWSRETTTTRESCSTEDNLGKCANIIIITIRNKPITAKHTCNTLQDDT